MKKYGFIGTGNMGFPLLKGAIGIVGADEVTFSTPFTDEMEKIKAATGAEYTVGNAALAGNSEAVVLCVKPQYIDAVLNELSEVDLSDKIIISIAAGVDSGRISAGLKQEVRIARIMPNTPAMVGEGMSCICFAEGEWDEARKCIVTSLFDAVGRYEILPENLMNAATCANGSSPAYVYMFIEALADSIVKYGIQRSTAYTLAAQTVLGSAKMVLETGEHPGKLKDNVCSPGGTTIAAVEALEEFGFRNAIMKATDACFEKSVELARGRQDGTGAQKAGDVEKRGQEK